VAVCRRGTVRSRMRCACRRAARHRGGSRPQEADKTGSRHLRQLLAEGRLPECWVPPGHILECRALPELYHDLRAGHTAWVQRVHAVFFHQGAPQLTAGALRTGQGAAAVRAAAAAHLSPAGQLQVATALDMLTCLEGHLEELRHRLLVTARHLTGAKVLTARLYGVGPVTALAMTSWLGGAVLLLPQSGPVRRAGHHRLLLRQQALARA
jgi:transposase